MTTFITGADAAYAENIPPTTDVVFGYIGGPLAYHVWTDLDWQRFTGRPKVPIWVAGFNGTEESAECIRTLKDLLVPPGSVIAVDLETRIDVGYVNGFFSQLHAVGYKVWVYGSLDTVFANPACNGYWVADYTGYAHMVNRMSVRATQWANDVPPGWDASLIKDWTLREMWV